MVSKLAQWYTLAKLKGPDAQKLELRVSVIDNIVKKKPIEWILDCLRTFLGKKVANMEFNAELIKLFTDSDPYFPQKKNELETRILAGAILSNYAGSSRKDKSFVLQTVRTGTFGLNEDDFINYDIIEDALKQLNEESITVRENSKHEQLKASFDTTLGGVDVATISSKFVNVNDTIKIIVNHINSTLSKRISLIDEESNIHWWIFRGYSNLHNISFSELDSKDLPFVLGIELSSLTRSSPGPYSAEQVIMKILSDIEDEGKEISIKDFINKISKEDKENHAIDPGIFGNLAPIYSALWTALNSADKVNWIKPFELSCGLGASNKFKPKDLAFQLYNESLIIKHFENK